MKRSPWQIGLSQCSWSEGGTTKPLVREVIPTIAFRVKSDGEQRFGARFQPAVLRPFQSKENGMHPISPRLLKGRLSQNRLCGILDLASLHVSEALLEARCGDFQGQCSPLFLDLPAFVDRLRLRLTALFKLPQPTVSHETSPVQALSVSAAANPVEFSTKLSKPDAGRFGSARGIGLIRMEQSHADVRPSEKSLSMTFCIECNDRWCRPPSFEWVEPDETTSFVTGMPFAQKRVKRNVSDLRSSDGIDSISLSELAISDPAYAPGMMSMRPLSKAAVALH